MSKANQKVWKEIRNHWNSVNDEWSENQRNKMTLLLKKSSKTKNLKVPSLEELNEDDKPFYLKVKKLLSIKDTTLREKFIDQQSNQEYGSINIEETQSLLGNTYKVPKNINESREIYDKWYSEILTYLKNREREIKRDAKNILGIKLK